MQAKASKLHLLKGQLDFVKIQLKLFHFSKRLLKKIIIKCRRLTYPLCLLQKSENEVCFSWRYYEHSVFVGFFLYERNLIKFISAFFDIKEENRSLDLSNDECVWYKALSLWTGFFICKALLSLCACWSQHITYTYLLVQRTILSVLFTQTATISRDKVEGNCCCQRGQYTCYRINNQ